MRITLPIGVALGAAFLCSGTLGAQAASAVQKECSQKYQAAKSADQLGGLTYNQYYSKCAADIRAEKAGAAPTTTAAPAAPTTTAPAPTTTTTAAPVPAPTTRTASPAPSAGGAAVFPTAISPEFSKDSAGKARRETCLAQYKKNKDANGNGGLKWIEKGGGYYSECNKRLKS